MPFPQGVESPRLVLEHPWDRLVGSYQPTTQEKFSFSGSTPLIPVLGKQKQVELCDLEASLAYIASLRSAKATQRACLKKKKKETKNKNKEGRKVSWFVFINLGLGVKVTGLGLGSQQLQIP